MKIICVLILIFNLVLFKGQKSEINIGIQLSKNAIEKKINQSVPEILYHDNSRTDDQLQIKVEKIGEIKTAFGKNQNLISEIPVKIWVEKGIGTMGFYKYQETEFQVNIMLNSLIKFKENWSIETQTRPNGKGFLWISKPHLNFGNLQIPLTSLVEKELKKELNNICKTIDNQIKKELKFEHLARMAWEKISQPYLISEEFQTWLKISPQNIKFSPATFYKNAVEINLIAEVLSQTFIGKMPEKNQTPIKIPNFQHTKKIAPDFILNTSTPIPYEKATEIAQKLLLNQKYDFNNDKITIKNLKISENNQKIKIEISTEGAVKGLSQITATPFYDAEKKEIRLKNASYKLKTKNIMHKTASLLFKNKIINTIENQYAIPTNELENLAKKNIEQTLNQDFDSIKIRAKVHQIQPQNILLSSTEITPVIQTHSDLKIYIHSL